MPVQNNKNYEYRAHGCSHHCGNFYRWPAVMTMMASDCHSLDETKKGCDILVTTLFKLRALPIDRCRQYS